MTMKLVQFGKLALSNNNAQEDYPLQARSALVQLRNGAFDQDGSEIVLQGRKARVSFRLVPPAVDEQLDHLRAELMTGRTILKGRLDDGRERVTYAKLVSLSAPLDPATGEFYQDVALELSLEFPYWIDANQIDFLDTGLTLDSGVVLDGAYIQKVMTASPLTFSVTNGGSARGTFGALAVIPRAPTSSLSDLVFTNLTNGYSLRYAGTITATQRLDIDFLAKRVLLDTTNAHDQFSLDSPTQMEYMLFELGGNNMRVLGTVSGTIDLYLQSPDLFL
jgi:hypothetical protein